MKTHTRTQSGRPSKARSRFGYDHQFWGEPAPAPAPGAEESYWDITRRPIPGLIFIAPLLLVYEFGVAAVGQGTGMTVRAGADAWIRQALATFGLTDRWLLPLGLFAALLTWHVIESRPWKFPPMSLLGMVFESLLLAVVLIGLSKAVDVGFARLENSPRLLATAAAPEARPALRSIVGYVGAGLYEETLFRLALIPLFYWTLRLLQVPGLMASTLAMTGSALLFSLAHHAGAPGEAFTWFAFIFRWLAGVFFGWVFVARGFGIAVGTHTAYDILVGCLDLHL